MSQSFKALDLVPLALELVEREAHEEVTEKFILPSEDPELEMLRWAQCPEVFHP